MAGAEAAQREALANYQRVILNAFRVTNDALVGSTKKREELGVQMRRVTALREGAAGAETGGLSSAGARPDRNTFNTRLRRRPEG